MNVLKEIISMGEREFKFLIKKEILAKLGDLYLGLHSPLRGTYGYR